MGPAVLVTLGVLFLVDNLNLNGLDFHNTWPLLLIVIGIVKVLQYTSPIEGHLARGMESVITPPPPAPRAGELPPTDIIRSGEQGVDRG